MVGVDVCCSKSFRCAIPALCKKLFFSSWRRQAALTHSPVWAPREQKKKTRRRPVLFLQKHSAAPFPAVTQATDQHCGLAPSSSSPRQVSACACARVCACEESTPTGRPAPLSSFTLPTHSHRHSAAHPHAFARGPLLTRRRSRQGRAPGPCSAPSVRAVVSPSRGQANAGREKRRPIRSLLHTRPHAPLLIPDDDNDALLSTCAAPPRQP